MEHQSLNNNERTLLLIACRWYKRLGYRVCVDNEVYIKEIANQANIKLSLEQVKELTEELNKL